MTVAALNQDEVIEKVLERVNEIHSNDYSVKSWPDKVNSSSKECDALVVSSNGESIAIEHTRIETFQGQIQDNAKLTKVFGKLNELLDTGFDFKLALTIPTLALQKGSDWEKVAERLKDWLVDNGTGLAWGRSRFDSVEGVPFRFEVDKNDARAGFARWAPELNEHEELVDIIARAIQTKQKQLKKYKSTGSKAFLVLESKDLALLNHIIFYKSFLRARRIVPDVVYDEIWYIRTVGTDILDLLCLGA